MPRPAALQRAVAEDSGISMQDYGCRHAAAREGPYPTIFTRPSSCPTYLCRSPTFMTPHMFPLLTFLLQIYHGQWLEPFWNINAGKLFGLLGDMDTWPRSTPCAGQRTADISFPPLRTASSSSGMHTRQRKSTLSPSTLRGS
ncbi:hypothetical protein BCR34DRAFT_249202 [Clohesyomyces aquaticus]|uniref:Uncharacterized protein n=1 Tax=Clohesyomyces aquaticus TaxID=1231657 RepID=A0A1Y1ZUI2_9PLEO|nr:hypothetical protein BCR34DRAFT_249202 [Clohesyomyces aquaticus]